MSEAHKTDVVESSGQAVAPAQSPDRMIELALEKGANVESLEKLMDLKERWEAQQARRAFNAAMSKFQRLCPDIKRTKKVAYKNVEYSYAPLPSIREQIQNHLTECNLSYRWEINEGDNGLIRVRCIVTHVDGHSESTEFAAYADDSGAKNDIQQRGSTVTYAQRYTLIGALGITSADTDDDGQSSGALNVDKIKRHNDALKDNLESVMIIKTAIKEEDFDTAAEAIVELDRATRDALWLAPTKGGIFTVEEMKTMRTEDFRKAVFEREGGSDPTEGSDFDLPPVKKGEA